MNHIRVQTAVLRICICTYSPVFSNFFKMSRFIMVGQENNGTIVLRDNFQHIVLIKHIVFPPIVLEFSTKKNYNFYTQGVLSVLKRIYSAGEVFIIRIYYYDYPKKNTLNRKIRKKIFVIRESWKICFMLSTIYCGYLFKLYESCSWRRRCYTIYIRLTVVDTEVYWLLW